MGSADRAVMYPNAIVYERALFLGSQSAIDAEALDPQNGKRLWLRSGAIPLTGSTPLLAIGAALERVNARTGSVLWRSPNACPQKTPTFASAVNGRLYVGCRGGRVVSIDPLTGRVLASVLPAPLDDYDQMVSLGHGRLGVSGTASGAYSYRQSAILDSQTLAVVIAFPPDRRIVGARDGKAIIDDACCQGDLSDSSPAAIEHVSLASGETVSSVSLEPYGNELPSDRDLPGPGVVVAAGNHLYLATHWALFDYDLSNLEAKPRTLYANLVDLPTLVNWHYLLLRTGDGTAVRRSLLLNSQNGMRVLWSADGGWQPSGSGDDAIGLTRDAGDPSSILLPLSGADPISVDPSCRLSTSGGAYAFVTCRNVRVPSARRLDTVPRCLTSGASSVCPGAVAAYALKTTP